MHALQHPWMSWKTYLQLEEESNLKHEYRDGQMVAMSGGTLQHAHLAAAVIRDLGAQLRDGPCLVATSDLKIRVRATDLCTYPDVSVICGKAETDPDSEVVVLNPTVLVEVTSDSTEAYDRGEKSQQYMRIDSLRELVLVSHREKLIEVFRRGEDGRFTRTVARTNEVARLESIKAELSVNSVYESIKLHGS